MAPPDQTIRGREAEVDSLQHPSTDSSFCSTVSVPEKAPEKDPAQVTLRFFLQLLAVLSLLQPHTPSITYILGFRHTGREYHSLCGEV